MEAIEVLISLYDKLSGPAKSSQKALADLEEQIKKDQEALEKLEGAMKRLQGGTSVNVAAFQKLQGGIDAKQQSLAGLTEKWIGMGGSAEGAAATVEGLGAKLEAFKASAAAAVIVALAMVAKAIAVATYQLAAFALSASDARRSFGLLLQGATGSAGAAKAMADQVAAVASKVPLADSALQEMALTLARAGLSGKAAGDALEALAFASSAAGGDAAKKLEELVTKSAEKGYFVNPVESLAAAGMDASLFFSALSNQLGIGVNEVKARLATGQITVEEGTRALAAAVRAQFGGVVARQTLGFDVQIMKAQENLSKLFDGVNIEPFLAGLHQVLGLLDQNTATGKALKFLFTKLLDGLFEAATVVFPYVKGFLQGIVIAALQLYIALKPVGRALREAFGGSSNIDAVAAGVTAAKIVFWSLVTVVGIVAISILYALAPVVVALALVTLAVAAMVATFLVGLALVAVAIVISLAPFILMGLLVYGAVMLISSAFQAAYDYLSGLDFGAIAENIINSLVDYISAGIPSVVAQMTTLGSSAVTALQSVLGIASPSKVFARLGHFTAAGFAEGVDAGSADVGASVGSMVDAPKALPRGDAAGRVNAGGITINIVNPRDAEEARRGVLEGLADAFEQLGLQTGAAV